MYKALTSGLKSMPTHSAHDLVFEDRYTKWFDARPIVIHTFGLCIRQILSASNISFDIILETSIPPWHIKPSDIVFDLVHLKKDCTYALVYRQHFLEISNKFNDFIQIYTDGSWDGNAVASAKVFPSETILQEIT